MKGINTLKYPLSLKTVLAVFCAFGWVQTAGAHENHVYRIGDKTYQFTVGSLNEPVAVDDKTGLDFRVVSIAKPGGEGSPVAGLDQTLKVELAAGAKKKVFSLQPSFGQPGSYRTAFYPTVQTTLSYRIFGSVDNVPVDMTFTCNPAGHPRSPDDNNEVQISDQVTQLSKRGMFGCPGAKDDMGFPEPAPGNYELQTRLKALEESLEQSRSAATRATTIGLAGAVLGLAGVVAGLTAWKSSRTKSTESHRRRASTPQ